MARTRRLILKGVLAATSPLPLPSNALDVAAGRDEILIGQSSVLSGPQVALSQGFNAGAALALSVMNESGGISGRRIRLITLDDAYSPTRAAENYAKLSSEPGIAALFCANGSPTTAAALPVLKQSGVALIGNTGVADSVRANSAGLVYYVRASYGREVEKIVEHLTVIGMRRIAVACIAGAGEAVVASVKESAAAKKSPLELVATAFFARNGTNTEEVAKVLVEANPQAIIVFMNAAPVIEVIRMVLQAGQYPSFYGMSLLACDLVAKTLGQQLKGITSCQVTPFPWNQADPTAREFQKRTAAAGIPVTYHTYEGYLNALFLIDVLRRAAPDIGRAQIHRVLRAYKGRIGGIDLDFTGGVSTGGRFVDLVHTRSDGNFIK